MSRHSKSHSIPAFYSRDVYPESRMRGRQRYSGQTNVTFGASVGCRPCPMRTRSALYARPLAGLPAAGEMRFHGKRGPEPGRRPRVAAAVGAAAPRSPHATTTTIRRPSGSWARPDAVCVRLDPTRPRSRQRRSAVCVDLHPVL